MRERRNPGAALVFEHLDHIRDRQSVDRVGDFEENKAGGRGGFAHHASSRRPGSKRDLSSPSLGESSASPSVTGSASTGVAAGGAVADSGLEGESGAS